MQSVSILLPSKRVVQSKKCPVKGDIRDERLPEGSFLYKMSRSGKKPQRTYDYHTNQDRGSSCTGTYL